MRKMMIVLASVIGLVGSASLATATVNLTYNWNTGAQGWTGYGWTGAAGNPAGSMEYTTTGLGGYGASLANTTDSLTSDIPQGYLHLTVSLDSSRVQVTGGLGGYITPFVDVTYADNTTQTISGTPYADYGWANHTTINVTATQGIEKVNAFTVWTYTAAGFIDKFGIDNFSVTLDEPAAVPEPAAAGLILAGGAVLFARRQARRKTVCD